MTKRTEVVIAVRLTIQHDEKVDPGQRAIGIIESALEGLDLIDDADDTGLTSYWAPKQVVDTVAPAEMKYTVEFDEFCGDHKPWRVLKRLSEHSSIVVSRHTSEDLAAVEASRMSAHIEDMSDFYNREREID